MYEVAISTIQEYIDEYLFEPRPNWPEDEFILRSCSRWAAEELIKRITDETAILPNHISGCNKKSPYRIIEGFIDEMDYFAVTTDNKKHRVIFSNARDTAIDIILLFL